MGRIDQVRAAERARAEAGELRRLGAAAVAAVGLSALSLFAIGNSADLVAPVSDVSGTGPGGRDGAGRTPLVPDRPVDKPDRVPPLAVTVADEEGTPGPTAPAERLVVDGVPATALTAYHNAEAVLRVESPSCGLDWALTAAIGRVESNHGRFGGAVLDVSGLSTPRIRGPRLDGARFALIRDTDGGALDGDTAFDRAVGPMQFLPGTWAAVGADGDGDGVRNPDDIHDAALGAGVYLCSGGGDLAQEAGRRSAVFRYNHSDEYVDLVLSLAGQYRAGGAAITGPAEVPGQSVDQPNPQAAVPPPVPTATTATTVPGTGSSPETPTPHAPMTTTTATTTTATTTTTTTATTTAPPVTAGETTTPAPPSTTTSGLLGWIGGLVTLGG